MARNEFGLVVTENRQVATSLAARQFHFPLYFGNVEIGSVGLILHGTAFYSVLLWCLILCGSMPRAMFQSMDPGRRRGGRSREKGTKAVTGSHQERLQLPSLYLPRWRLVSWPGSCRGRKYDLYPGLLVVVMVLNSGGGRAGCCLLSGAGGSGRLSPALAGKPQPLRCRGDLQPMGTEEVGRLAVVTLPGTGAPRSGERRQTPAPPGD